MYFRRLTKMALAAMVVLSAVQQAPAGIPITTPTTVTTSARVDNSMVIVVSNTDIGRFSVTGSPIDTATASFSPAAASISGDPGTGIRSSQPASFVWDGAHMPQSPTIALSAGFHNAPIFVTYSNVVDLACPGGTIRITHITDDLAIPGIWDHSGGPITSSAGQDSLDGSGSRTFHIGMTLRTTNATYASGACTGSFDFTVEY
jgi:hypothetical protein